MAQLLIFLVLFLSGPAHAGTPVSTETAQAYYRNCLATPDDRMSKETQDIFCECTSMYLRKGMTLEDMQTMVLGTREARLALNKMIVNVYAPCMEFPVRDFIYKRCREDAHNIKKEMCSCLARDMALYTAATAQDQLRAILAENPEIVDPMAPIVNSESFLAKERETAFKCAVQ